MSCGEREKIEEWLARGGDARYADLRGADLRNADLRNADLRNADLRYADLRGAKLRGADLRNAGLRDADLWDADLRGAELRGAELRGAELRGLPTTAEWLDASCEATDDGWIVYRRQDGHAEYPPPPHWAFAPGTVLDRPDPRLLTDRRATCGPGVHFATRAWCDDNHPGQALWRCLIRREWVEANEVCVPYATDGKGRSARLELLSLEEEE